MKFSFNVGVEESIASAKKQLEKIALTDEAQKASLKKAAEHLNEGVSALKMRQKHIKVADRSEYGWNTVRHYQSDPLASDSEDEKELHRAEKDAKKDFEQLEANKRRRGGGAGSGKGRRSPAYHPYTNYHQDIKWDGLGFSSIRGNPSAPRPLMATVPQRRAGNRVLGPSFHCGAFGRLMATCPSKGRPYPFAQAVVSSAENITVDLDEMSGHAHSVNKYVAKLHADVEGVNSVQGTIECVNKVQDTAKVSGNLSPVEQVTVTDNSEYHYGDGVQEVSKFWKVEAITNTVQITDVQGRLKKNITFWREVLQAPPPVLECIELGYRLPLKFIPPAHCQQNHKSTELHSVFVDEAVQSLIVNRCVMKVHHQPEVCSPLSVVGKPQGKLRLVLNLKYLNQFLHVLSFKYEDLRTAALMFEQGEYMFKFDLKSGYHHINIWPEHYKFLGFRWDRSGEVGYYVFKVLPFGLSIACYLFTKLTRPLI